MQPRTRREQLLPNSGLGAVNAVQSPAHAQEWLDFIKLINLFRPLAAPRGWGGLEVGKLSLCLNPAKAIIEKAESCWRYITAATSIPTNFSVRPNSLLNAQAVVSETICSKVATRYAPCLLQGAMVFFPKDSCINAQARSRCRTSAWGEPTVVRPWHSQCSLGRRA